MTLPTRLLLLAFVVALAVMCGELLPGCASHGAPAPLPSRRRDRLPDSLAGEWLLTWSGSVCGMTLHPDGRYEARTPSGATWRGTWTQRGRTLAVWETYGGGRVWCYWSARLSRDLEGVTAEGHRVALRRVGK